MDSIIKILPLTHFWSGLLTDIITDIWIVLTIAFAWNYFNIFKKAIAQITKQSKDLDNVIKGENYHAVLESEMLKDYKKKFVDYDGQEKAKESSANFLDIESLLSQKLNIELHESIPSKLVGLGVLGTFVGLTLGISGFDTSSSDSIKSSITYLLAGMATAFLTSVYGMSLSLLYSWLAKNIYKKASKELESLTKEIDQKFLLTENELATYEQLKSIRVLRSVFEVESKDGSKIPLGNVIRDIYEESKEQTGALKSFSTDLAIKIEAGFEKILNSQETGSIVQKLQEIESGIKNLGGDLSKAPKEMTEDVVKNLTDSISIMIETLKETITKTTNDELSKLSESLSKTIDILNKFPLSFDTTVKTNEKAIEKLMGEVNTTIEVSKKDKQESLKDQKEVAEKLSDLLVSIESSISRYDVLINSLTETINGINNAGGTFQRISVQLNESTSKLETTSGNLNKSQDAYDKFLKESISSTQKTIEELGKSLTNYSEFVDELIKEFNVITEKTQPFFDDIEKGVLQYSEAVSSSIEEFTAKFATLFSDAAKKLENTISINNALMLTLSDEVKKLNSYKAR